MSTKSYTKGADRGHGGYGYDKGRPSGSLASPSQLLFIRSLGEQLPKFTVERERKRLGAGEPLSKASASELIECLLAIKSYRKKKYG